MLTCDKCGASIYEGSKYCPKCGDPVTEIDKTTVPTTGSHIANVEISFGKSSSPNYTKAVEICKNIPSYSTTGEEKQIQHRINLPITEIDLIINLFELVGSWKSSQMLINGHISTKKDLTYYGVGCYRNRQKAYQADQFCFGENDYDANIWGCKKLNMPIYEWGGGWLNYGQFDKSGIWHFDKDKIRHELALGIKENELCPVLDKKRIFETLDKIPNSINPKSDKNWEYSTRYEEIDGEYKEVAIGIKPIINKINRYVVGSFSPSWNIQEEDRIQTAKTTQEEPASYQDDRKNLKKDKVEGKKSTFLYYLFLGVALLLIYVLTK